jgi:hypothetical protein
MYICPYFYNMMRRNDEMISKKNSFTTEEAIWIGRYLNIRFDKFDVEQFRTGLDVELEHGRINPNTNASNDDPIITGKIALAHLNEFPDYYTRLTKMEEEAEKYWGDYHRK